MDEALEIIARLGTDDAPSLDELTTARDEIARALHALRAEGSSDLEAMMSLREAYSAAAAGIEAIEAEQAEASAKVDEALDGIPNPDAPEVTVEETEAVAASSSIRALPIREAVARLGLTPRTEGDRTEVSVFINGDDVGADAGFRDLARAYADSRSSNRSGQNRIARIATTYSEDRSLTGSKVNNTRLVDSLLSPEAVSAAGGCCSLADPIRENPVLSSTARPIRDSLPTMGAPHGAVDFFPAMCLDGSIEPWTCEDDALVDPANEATWKPCVDLECEEKQTVNVYGIPVCATVGNFQQRFAPEQWEAKLRVLSALQARAAEIALFNAMRLGVSTTHTGQASGSTYVNVLNTISLAAATIRQDQRYLDVMLHVWLPDWIRQAIRADLRTRKTGDQADSVEATDAALASALADEGVNVTYSPDVNPIEEESPGQVDGPLTPYPGTASGVIAPEGHFSFLDGGTLDFGTEIRDHDLNRQNKLSAFAESFEGLLARGCNAKALDIPIEDCDTVPCPA